MTALLENMFVIANQLIPGDQPIDMAAVAHRVLDEGPAHAPLSPSHSETWSVCTGSQILEADMPEQETSEQAQEGTIAHGYLEQSLTFDSDPFSVIPKDVLDEHPDMAEAVAVAVDWVNGEMTSHPGTKLFLELQVKTPWDDVWGTSDIVMIGPNRIHIADYKHGKGVWVDVDDNRQLLLYLIGVLNTLSQGEGMPLDLDDSTEFVTTIIQPRAGGNPVRSKTYTKDEIFGWIGVFNDAIERIKAGEENYAPGEDTCRWCRAKPVCKALHDKCLQDAQVWFSDIEPMPTTAVIERHATASPAKMTDDQVVTVMENAALIKAWLSAVMAHATDEAKQGKLYPGFKLVDKYGNREWAFAEGDDPIKKLVNMGLKRAEIVDESLKGPAAVEELVKKSKWSKRKKDNFDKLITRNLRGRVLVPDNDDRPAIPTTAEAMFADVAPTL